MEHVTIDDVEPSAPGNVECRKLSDLLGATGEYQSGRNDTDRDLVALALGVPRDSEDVRIPLACPECGHDYLHPEAGVDGPLLSCPNCAAENVPEGCPDCGHEMQVTLGESEADESGAETETVVVCPDCDAKAENPFRE